MTAALTLHPAAYDGLTAAAVGSFVLACARAPWRGWLVGHPDRQHVWLGSLVAVLAIGALRTDLAHGLLAQPLFVTTLTLMHGWLLAIVGLGAVLAADCLQQGGWSAWPAHFLCDAVVPAAFIQALCHLVGRRLPRSFWIYLFVTAFAGTIVAVALSSLALRLVSPAPTSGGPPLQDYLVLMLLTGFAEAWANGLLMSVAVVYRPDWVSTYAAPQS